MAYQITDSHAAACIEMRGKLQTNQGGSRRLYRPQVAVHMTDRRIASALRNHFCVGNIESFRPTTNPALEVFARVVKGAGCVEVLKRTAPIC